MEHTTVLLDETVDALRLRPGMTVVDGTLGGAGHAEAILKQILPGGRLIGIDKDEYAIGRAGERLSAFEQNTVLVHDDFSNIKAVLERLDIDGIDGAVLDLGVSSFQLDQCNRGFSYKEDSRLDMRMNKKDKTCAADIVNSYAQKDLERILKDYGEERWAARIAAFIVRERRDRPIETTMDLVEIIKKAIPRRQEETGRILRAGVFRRCGSRSIRSSKRSVLRYPILFWRSGTGHGSRSSRFTRSRTALSNKRLRALQTRVSARAIFRCAYAAKSRWAG